MKNCNKSLRVIILLLLSMYFGISISYGQLSKNYIYAKVIVKDSSSFEGLVKFGKKTFLWSDFFKLDKTENPYGEYISKEKQNKQTCKISDVDGLKILLNNDLTNLAIHKFEVRMGYIKAMDFLDNRYISIELKDNKFINLRTDYSHSDLDIEILDNDLGKVKLDASLVARIEFMSTPEDIQITRPKPIYGTVLTKQGEFTGFICWDNDETSEDDLLDGEWGNKDVSIYFKNIASIEKSNSCCNVTTLSGTNLQLCGSNDVDNGNRGLVVNMPNIGKLSIDWRDFESLQLNHSIDGIGLSYDDYLPAQRLKGKVSLKDKSEYSGIIIYNLDKAMTVENIDGENAGLSFTIPLLYVKSISPKGLKYSKLVLKNGLNLLLGNSVDVNYKNDGVLVFTEDGKSEFLNWFDIENISFQ